MPDPQPKSQPPVENESLLAWDVVCREVEWTGLLLGNGASIAFWDGFKYDSIFVRAQSPSLTHRLDDDDRRIFEAFKTTNFEQILAALKTSRVVLNVLGYDAAFIESRYDSIQNALFDAIHSVHVPWGTTLRFEPKLRGIRDELEQYKWVYSLNYDLIVYWAIMSKHGGHGFADFFWNSGLLFDPAKVEPPDYASEWPRIVWLHGGIHLRRDIDGTVYKERATDETLLDKFQTSYSEAATPLLVSEGTADDKYRAITRSAYLDFALRSLAEHEGGLVIFGSSLRAEDQHLVRAINEQPVEDIAVSLRSSNDPATIRQRKAELRAHFPSSNLFFFDAATHPLGAVDLTVKRLRLFGRTP